MTEKQIIKMSKILMIIGAICSFFLPIVPLFILIGICLFIDTITGIIKSKKNKVSIKSDRLFYGIAIKSFVYLTVIVIMYIAEYFVINEFMAAYFSIQFVITKLLSLFFMGIELYSTDENIRKFNNDKGFKYYFVKIIKTLKSNLNQVKTFKDKFDEFGEKKKDND